MIQAIRFEMFRITDRQVARDLIRETSEVFKRHALNYNEIWLGDERALPTPHWLETRLTYGWTRREVLDISNRIMSLVDELNKLTPVSGTAQSLEREVDHLIEREVDLLIDLANQWTSFIEP